MLTWESTLMQEKWPAPAGTPSTVAARPRGLYLLTEHDLREIDEALVRERLPMDFEQKLSRLGRGTLTERYVEQNSGLIFSLLLASRQGAFAGVTSAADDLLLRVLAYVRKDEDAIPDYRLDGFKDDAQEIRAVEAELRPVLHAFKAWRLRHQVPGLWLRAAAHLVNPREAAC
jgi:hypothetical protein